jgi:hypothetical protein
MGVGEIGRERERPVIARERFSKSVEVPQHIAAVAQRLGMFGRERDRPLAGGERLDQQAATVLQDREQAKGVESMMVAIEQGETDALGVAEMSGRIGGGCRRKWVGCGKVAQAGSVGPRGHSRLRTGCAGAASRAITAGRSAARRVTTSPHWPGLG